MLAYIDCVELFRWRSSRAWIFPSMRERAFCVIPSASFVSADKPTTAARASGPFVPSFLNSHLALLPLRAPLQPFSTVPRPGSTLCLPCCYGAIGAEVRTFANATR
jgi:hypothetical protein